MAQEKSQVCLSGLRSAACGALGTMGVGPALSAESKAGIIAMLTAAVKDSEEHVRSAACGALGTVGVDPVARRPKLCWMPIASPMSASVRCGP